MENSFEWKSKYVKKIISNPKINAIKNVNTKIINFKNNKVVLKIGESEIKYDHLILATHSDQVKEINKIINFDEKLFLMILNIQKIKFTCILTINLCRIKKLGELELFESDVKGKLSVTYWMNKLRN